MPALIKNRRVVAASSPQPESEVLRLGPADDPAAFAARLAHATRVEVEFPKFGDGRGFSIGRLLRERYAYRGELRAVGQITRDHLLSLERCGFDAFELRDGEDAQAALAGFDVFGEAYQGTVTQPLPLFRRRA